MKPFFEKVGLVLKDPVIRKRIVFTVLALIVFRLLSSIPIPGVDVLSLDRLLAGNQLLGLLDIFSGGGISRLSIVMLGVGPFITASIIMQVMTMVFPKLKSQMQEEGDAGRMRLSQWSRYLSVPLAFLQSFAFLKLLESQNILQHLTMTSFVLNVLVVTAGSLLLMWVGELISEFGIGNGVSLIIFAGIVATLPSQIAQFVVSFDPQQLPYYALFLAIAVGVIALVVLVTEAERPIPVTYAKQVRGNSVSGGTSTYLPFRLNQAGVIPIIFALSILLLPQVAAQFLAESANATVASIAGGVSSFLGNSWYYSAIYFVLVFLFTYFYTAITFDPQRIAENLQKGGAFVPGVRPGDATALHLAKIVTRITFVGAIFLALIAVLPLILQAVTGNAALAIGGTALLIVVSVVLDLVKRIDAQAAMREY
ncbi:MAG: preprotein translocase subunit SecY [Patescibacteria group bacterium]